MVTSDIKRSQRRGDTDVSLYLTGVRTVEDLVAQCQRRSAPEIIGAIGWTFAFSNATDSVYSHTTAPGGLSCENDGNPKLAFVSAGSEHGDMVNLLLCDGSVQQYGYSVDLRIWKALGTRAGGDEF